jgi:predicted amidohydrolase
MRVTAIQMEPGHDKEANIAQASALIAAAVDADRPTMVSLPEMWPCLGGSRQVKIAQAEHLPVPGEDAAPGSAYAFLREMARGFGIFVHGGSIAELDPDGQLANTTIVFDPDGREIARYRKIHMFDITTPDGQSYRESDSYRPGDKVVTFAAGGTTVGCAICYDLRFPEMFLTLRRAGAEIIMLPSAFTMQTGKDHWEVLIRARAIETQTWLVAAATTGRHQDARGGTRLTYGHSMIVDPWGHVVARASDGIGFASARIDPALTERVRRDMPVLEHRRLA